MYNSKPKKSDCDCRRRKKGNPKIATGICFGFGLRNAVKERIQGKRIAQSWWQEVGEDPDDTDF